MTAYKPVVLVNGVLTQLPDNDTILAEIDEMPYTLLTDFDDVNNVIYKGWAPEGSASSAAVWRIARIAFVGPDEDVEKVWANNNSGFVHKWDDRADPLIITYPSPDSL